MKGIVFTEFFDMVEKEFGYEMVDRIISENELSSNGVYTRIGTYDHSDIVKLITSLSGHTKIGVPSLLKAFGFYFFDVLQKNYTHFLDKAKNAFDFLESIETYIHVEVKKLYPNAELPTFETRRTEDGKLEMIYYSERKMADFAEALIEKSMAYYDTEAKVEKLSMNDDGSKVKFLITKL